MVLLDDAHARDFIKHLEEFEGRTNFLYSDIIGRPTVGVGCSVLSPGVAESLNWSGGIDSVAVAASQWLAVKHSTPGLMAAAYAHLTTLRLPDVEIDRLRDYRIKTTESDVIRAIRGVSDFPMPVRCAILDLAWNIGTGHLHSQYFGPASKFGPALYRGDWQTAAAESARRGVQPARNGYVRDLIMSALADEPTTRQGPDLYPQELPRT